MSAIELVLIDEDTHHIKKTQTHIYIHTHTYTGGGGYTGWIGGNKRMLLYFQQ